MIKLNCNFLQTNLFFVGLLVFIAVSCQQPSGLMDNNFLSDANCNRSFESASDWKVNVQYNVGDYVIFRESVFEVIQAHTSLSTWTPPNVPALFTLVKPSDPIFIGWDTNVNYMKGEHIMDGEKVYEVVQSHKSQEDWAPKTTRSLYKPISINNALSTVGNNTSLDYAFPAGDYVNKVNINVDLEKVKEFYNNWKDKYIKYTFSKKWVTPNAESPAGSGYYRIEANSAYLMYNPVMAYEDDNSQWIGLESNEPDENGHIAVTTSESHGYAMLIAAYMNDHELFDLLLNFYSNFKSSTNGTELMCWQIWSETYTYDCGELEGNGADSIVYTAEGWGPADLSMFYTTSDTQDSATDGDMDIAYALLLAGKQWNDSSYTNQAKSVISDILNYDIYSKGESLTRSHIKLGNATKDNDPSDYNGYKFNMGDVTRPSDFLLNHLSAFKSVSDTADATKWDNVYNTTQSIINTSLEDNVDPDTGESTGLLPDFMIYDTDLNKYIPVPKPVLEAENDGNFNFNAPRSLWRIGVEAAVNGTYDSKNFVNSFASWASKSDGGNILSSAENLVATMTVDGTPLANWYEVFSLSSAMVSASVSDYSDVAKVLYNKVINEKLGSDPIGSSSERTGAYYGDTVKVLSLITVSEGWWDPTK